MTDRRLPRDKSSSERQPRKPRNYDEDTINDSNNGSGNEYRSENSDNTKREQRPITQSRSRPRRRFSRPAAPAVRNTDREKKENNDNKNETKSNLRNVDKTDNNSIHGSHTKRNEDDESRNIVSDEISNPFLDDENSEFESKSDSGIRDSVDEDEALDDNNHTGSHVVDDSDSDFGDFDDQLSSFFNDEDEKGNHISISPVRENGSKRPDVSAKNNFDKTKLIEKYAHLSNNKLSGKDKKRYRHYTEQNTVVGRQIEFYKNLNLSKTYDQHKVSELLTPPTDKQETPEQKLKRERLITQAIGGEEALRRDSKLRITDKDVEVLRFLAMFKFSNARNVAKMFAEREDTTRKRLNRLRNRGLVLSNKIYGLSNVYFLSEEGMILSGYDYKTLKESEINPSSFPHTTGVSHIASCLMGANIDVLDFGSVNNGSFPTRNRRIFDENERKFVLDFGEMIVSEFEIQTRLGKRRGSMKGEIYKPAAQGDIASAMRTWKRKLDELKELSNNANSNNEKMRYRHLVLEHIYSSPEMIHENEWMWALFPRDPADLIHHVPDLVVKRPRDAATGKPNSIAVELELTAKNSDLSYVKTLKAYKNDENMYAEVIWVSPNKSIRKKLQKIADETGLSKTGKFRVIPLYYEHGEWPVSEHLGKI